MQNIRNIGILAHVDAGKTTLTEQLLRHSGAIREAGAVDSGTAHADRLDIERRRGISVRATCLPLVHGDTRIHLIDTPGHTDFAAEVERALWALDGAILLLSAADPIQPHAITLFSALQRGHIPTLIFLNKCDRESADPAATLAQARRLLTPRAVDPTDADALHALLAEDDEQALADYLSGNLYPLDVLCARLPAQVRACQAYPAFCGSALHDAGIPALLDAIATLLPPPGGDAGAPPSGIVFALGEEDRTLGRAALVRLFHGTLKNREAAPLHQENKAPQPTKITQIRALSIDGRAPDLGQLSAGEIGAVYGLGPVPVGQVIGDPLHLPRPAEMGRLSSPLLMVKVTPQTPALRPALRGALLALAQEDPLLGVEVLGGEAHVRVMGAIQLEILADFLQNRFGLDTAFGPPHVIYHETIARPATGFYAYTMPKPCWAVIEFALEPLPRGAGIRYAATVPSRQIMPRYQHQVEQALPMALRQGMLGWQVDDIAISLIGGEHHLIHTHPLDFILATPIALMDGLRRAGPVVLEPILAMRVTLPEVQAGRLLSEIAAMRGAVQASTLLGDTMHIDALVPLATSLDFSVRLAALTSGRGSLSVSLHGYGETPLDPPPICPRQGVHPLDTAAYILAARGALSGGVFDG